MRCREAQWLSNEALGDVLTAGLTAIGIDPDATAVYLRADGVERQQLLVATPLGVVAADRQMLVNDPHNRARLFMRWVPWDKLSDLTMETESIRDPEPLPTGLCDNRDADVAWSRWGI